MEHENLNTEENANSDLGAVMRCGLSEVEFTERERLLELQRSATRWFSQEEFDRLKELSNNMKKWITQMLWGDYDKQK